MCNLRKSLAVIVSIVALSGLQCTAASIATDAELITNQAVSLAKQGKLQQAIDLEAKAISTQPGSWLAHAAMSYFLWQQGAVLEALAEGKQAANLAPQNEFVLTNLAKMQYAFCDYRSAIPTYEAAKKVAPDDWLPWLGLAQSYIANGRRDEGFALLKEMGSQANMGFDWYFQLSTTYLQLDRSKLAANSASEAVRSATTSDQKALATNQLYLALLLDNQLVRADAMKEQVFIDKRHKDSEIYVRTAVALLPASAPAGGLALLEAAMTDLKAKEDSEAFYKLGKAFQAKTVGPNCSTEQAQSWVEAAGTAYTQALKLETREARYHLALAAILEKQDKFPEMMEELGKAQSIDSGDSLAPFLVSSLASAQRPLTTPPYLLNLSKVRFGINGLSCACKISGIESIIRKINGVAFVSIIHQKPYKGIILIDQSLIPVAEAFRRTVKADGLNTGPQAPPSGLLFEVVSSEPVKNVAAAIKIAQDLEAAETLNRQNQLKPFLPVLPENLGGTVHRSEAGAKSDGAL